MGKVYDSVTSLLDKRIELANLSSKCQIPSKNREIQNAIEDAVKLMKPLSYKRQAIDTSSRPHIYIGAWISEKSFYHTYGRSTNHIYYHLKKYGDIIPDMCRRPIQEDMRKICGVLRDFEKLEWNESFSIKVPENTIRWINLRDRWNMRWDKEQSVHYNKNEAIYNEITVRASSSDYVVFLYNGQESARINMMDMSFMYIIDDVYDDVKRAYVGFIDTIGDGIKRNEEIKKDIEDITLAYKIALNLL